MIHQPVTTHRAVREPDVLPTLSKTQNDISVAPMSNCKRPALTCYVADATERWISLQPRVKFQEILSYILRCPWYREKEISARNFWFESEEIRLASCVNHMSAKDHALTSRNPDLHTTMSMPPDDVLASDRPLNVRRYELTFYITDPIRWSISYGPTIDSGLTYYIVNMYRNVISRWTCI